MMIGGDSQYGSLEGGDADDDDDRDQLGGPSEVPREYDETRYQQLCWRCCGRCWFLTLAFCIVAWIFHSISVARADPCFLAWVESSQSDVPFECSPEDVAAGRAHWDLAPQFSKSLIWSSIAHHTGPWQRHWRASAPPPPPNF